MLFVNREGKVQKKFRTFKLPFVVGEGRPEVTEITYEALYNEVAVYAAALKKLGIQKGDRVVGKKSVTLLIQGSHRLEKYLNIQDCLEKSLKIEFALKST